MSKTLPEIIDWLKSSDHIRIILVEVKNVMIQGVSSTLYLSNKPFITSNSDTPSNTAYMPCIQSGITFSESIDLSGAASIGYGDIEINNTDGSKDSWLDYVWSNRDIDIYIGDPRWSRDSFYRIFTGTIYDISSRDQSTLNIVMLNKLDKLNSPITEELIGGSGSNKDRVKPLLFGECFNIEPVNTDSVPNTLEYMVHNGPIEDIIEVRDNGVPVLFTKNLSQGKFNLSRNPAGQITASVQGYKLASYTNTIGDIIKTIVTAYGPANSRLTLSDVDTTSLTQASQAAGIYCKDSENVLDTCQTLAASIGGSLIIDTNGKLKFVKIGTPDVTEKYSITSDDIEYHSISISDKPLVKGSIKLAYCKNWTPQTSSLAAGLPSNHLPVFQDEWYYINVSSSTVLSNYILSEQPSQEDTYLINGTEALTEANSRLTQWSSPKYIVTLVCFAHLLPVELGDTVRIQHPRYNLDAGKNGIVISVDRDWLAGRVTIGVLI